ncbi:LuxR C-terminal-related transcriptional regulator [Bacilliculturomica massiliensis]|uniref:LuxR C-terminal-related transcriptional regulator n=1 Tax=Bacilliculturomica massiliensis TaxID=1917867 RepID=UPI00102FF631|nr:LuxR C-terminal-related transcriptional regulator [Bacilliculturomica massiliensis]
MPNKRINARIEGLLNEKYTPAALPDIYAPRHNLMAVFQRASENRFVFVGAPSGSGKTVSAQLWLKRSGRRSVWIGLDRYDDSPSVFFKLLSKGLYSVCPENENMLKIITSPAFSSVPVEHTVQLLSELYAGKGSYALVLDDMHVIDNGEILKSLPAILRRLPRSFVVLILSRGEIPGEFQSLFREEALSVITQDNLRFTEEEILQYFSSLNQRLTAEESRFVCNVTGGWAIGVNAVAKSGIPEESIASGFARYFEIHIWNRWEPRIREFCLKTSVADEFDAELARLLTGEEDALPIMRELSRANDFLSNLHDDTYRYHHMFLDFLRSQTAKNKADTSGLYKLAADYYKSKGDYSKALRFWAASGDFRGISGYLYLFLFENNRGAVAEYADFLSTFFSGDFPAEAFGQFPPLHIAAAWYHYLTSHREEFESHMDAVYQNLPSIALAQSKFVEYAILAYSVDYRTSILDKIKNFSKFGRYIHQFTAEGLATSIASFTQNLPFMHRSNLDYSDLSLDPASRQGVAKTFALFLGPEWNYLQHHIWACFDYERNHLDSALLQNSRALELLNGDSRPEGRICVCILQISILYRLERFEEAETAGRVLEDFVRSSAKFFLPNLAAFQVRRRLWHGDRAAARDWLAQYFVVETDHVELFRIYQHFSTARAYLVLNRTEEAMGYIGMLRRYGREFNRPLDEGEACVLQSVLEWALGQKKEAVSTLETALGILQPYSFTRVVADEGAAVLPVLKRLYARLSRQDHRNETRQRKETGPSLSCVNEIMLAAYRFSKGRAGVAANIRRKDKPVKLSRQQRQMVLLLSLGYRGTAIAERTGLSLSTVKSHLTAAYRKLEVNNAMDAVIRARELGLIE